jgi:acyl carrier protein
MTKEDIQEKVKETVLDLNPELERHYEKEKNTPLDELYFDSLDRVEMVLELEEKVGVEIADEEWDRADTISAAEQLLFEKAGLT